MTKEPNMSQKTIAEGLDGFYVVDAGPGTGKTFTIVSRYVNILKKPDVQTKDVLLLTFTRNAAAEMEERIRDRLAETETGKDTRLIQAGTFDSFCYSVVKESPESVSDFLGLGENLTRSASSSRTRPSTKSTSAASSTASMQTAGTITAMSPSSPAHCLPRCTL